MFDMQKDEWYHLYRSEEETLDFCTARCTQDFFMAQRMIEGIEEA